MNIAGKVALITGGTGGLGKAFAKALLNGKAAAVCLVDIAKNGSEVAADLSKQYQESKVDFSHCDVTDYSKFKAVFDKLEKDYGGVDIVCNNAGIICDDRNVEDSQKAFRINMEAVYWGTKLGTDYMKKRAGGIVVNVASVAGLLPVGDSIVYAATKHGVVGMSRSAALNFDLTGVRVCALCPAFTETPILDTLPGMRGVIEKLPKTEIMKPEFIAEGFLQLVGDEASNGAVMSITSHLGINRVNYPPEAQGARLSNPANSSKSKL